MPRLDTWSIERTSLGQDRKHGVEISEQKILRQENERQENYFLHCNDSKQASMHGHTTQSKLAYTAGQYLLVTGDQSDLFAGRLGYREPSASRTSELHLERTEHTVRTL